jgi:hypothetical protein
MVSGQVAVQFPAGKGGFARQAAETATFSLEKILKHLGITVEGQVRVQLVNGHEEFERACGQQMPDWALAAAVGGDRIVADASKATPATANDIHLSMVHEMVHLALAQVEKGRPDRLPHWFHEGTATWLSGRQPLVLDRGVFRTAATHGALIPLKDLSNRFPEDERDAELAYLESEDFIGWLASVSPEGLHGIVDRYKAGERFEAAFAKAAGMPLDEAEARWAGSLRKSYPWLRTLLSSLTFWSVMAVATVLVFFLVRYRSRRQRRQWEEEEQVFSVLDLDEPPAEEPDEDEEPEQEWDPGEPIHG